MREVSINPKEDLIFDPKVVEMCKSCERYGKKATCPPHIESFGYYSQLLPQYEHGILYVEKFVVAGDYLTQGKKSSLSIHRKILSERKALFEKGHYFSIGFGAGSCKLCKKCSFPCPKPDESLIPIEAAGLNVIATLAKQGIEIKVPAKGYFYRVGVIFYD